MKVQISIIILSLILSASAAEASLGYTGLGKSKIECPDELVKLTKADIDGVTNFFYKNKEKIFKSHNDTLDYGKDKKPDSKGGRESVTADASHQNTAKGTAPQIYKDLRAYSTCMQEIPQRLRADIAEAIEQGAHVSRTVANLQIYLAYKTVIRLMMAQLATSSNIVNDHRSRTKRAQQMAQADHLRTNRRNIAFREHGDFNTQARAAADNHKTNIKNPAERTINAQNPVPQNWFIRLAQNIKRMIPNIFG